MTDNEREADPRFRFLRDRLLGVMLHSGAPANSERLATYLAETACEILDDHRTPPPATDEPTEAEVEAANRVTLMTEPGPACLRVEAPTGDLAFEIRGDGEIVMGELAPDELRDAVRAAFAPLLPAARRTPKPTLPDPGKRHR